MYSFIPKSLFTPEFFIDSIQSAKENFTDRIITDPVLNKAAHNFMSHQTAFAKMLLNNTVTVSNYFMEQVIPKQKQEKD